MRKHIFTIAWILIGLTLATVSFYFKDGTEAMVAQVETRSTTISFLKPVIIKSIKGIPGQSVTKGEVLVVVERPDLQLDVDQVETEIQLRKTEIRQKELEYSQTVRELNFETEVRINELKSDIQSLELEQAKAQDLQSKLHISKTSVDSIRTVQIQGLLNEIEMERVTNTGILRSMKEGLESEINMLNDQIVLLNKKKDLNSQEAESMTQTAPFDGIIGTIDAREGELVSPYTKVLSLYESSPTLIKAFMNERINYEVFVGQPVTVESENRQYKISGKVIELGARITSYPLKLEPIQNQVSYGREVFIEIPPKTHFLNGEKVFVYPVEK